MLVSVVIPVFNRDKFLKKCLNSVFNQTMSDYEVIVVDDGSTDGTREILDKYARRIKLYFQENNRGVSCARNQGVELSRGEFVVMIDSDCIADPDWLTELIKPFYQDKNIMIVGGRVVDMPARNYWQMVNNGFNTFVAHDSGYIKRVIGCNMAFRREFVLRHPYNERLKFAAGDDTELCWQCRRHGYKVFYTHQAIVSHSHRNTLKGSIVQQFLYGYVTTYMLVKFRHFPYLPCGSYLMIFMLVFLLIGYLGAPFTGEAVFLCLVLFLYLPYYHGSAAKARSGLQTVCAYPGHFILHTAFCIGCLVYFFMPQAFIQKVYSVEQNNKMRLKEQQRK